MARRKNAPESVRVKHGLSERLRELRNEFYGDRGGPDLARSLGIPVRTWYNYETGVTVPAEIILRIVEITSVEPVWLLRGEGPKFREKPMPITRASAADAGHGLAGSSVATLLRTALERLERSERGGYDDAPGRSILFPSRREEWEGAGDESGMTLIDAGGVSGFPLTPADGPRYLAARGEWLDARRAFRHLRMADDAMAPIVAEGAQVAYAEAEPASDSLHEKLVVTFIDDRPTLRWFQHCGRYALLRAENKSADPASTLIDLEGPDAGRAFHRVLWISTPH